jgi:hypothetical protein
VSDATIWIVTLESSIIILEASFSHIYDVYSTSITYDETIVNGTAQFKNCKKMFEYQHILLLRDIWWPKF